MKNIRKKLLVFAISLTAIVILVVICISPFAKYLIEKYDVKYTGRQITVDKVYLNPFTGYVNLNKLKIHELKSDSLFLSSESVSADLTIYKLLFKTVEINNLTLNQPKGIVIQTGKTHDLNFKDLIEKFSPKKTKGTKTPMHVNLVKIKIINGEFHYRENTIPINYFIKQVNLESNGIYWNVDTIPVKFSFLSGIKTGSMKGNLTVNTKNLDYHVVVKVNKFDLNIIDQYLKDLTNYGHFSANLDANVNSKGNFKDNGNVTNSAHLTFNDFHFGKNPADDYASFDKLVIAIKQISPKNHRYLFDSVSLTHPYLKYERYDHLDNIQTMFGAKGEKAVAAKNNTGKFNLIIEIGNYIERMARNFFKSHYNIDRAAIYNGHLKFNDFSINEKFSAELNPLYFSADSVDENRERVSATLESGIKPYGYVAAGLNINPKNEGDFEMKYHLKKLPVALFNPYLISLTSFPFQRGTLEINGNWHVKNSTIQSNNHLLVIDPLVDNRVKNDNTKWIPVKFLMFFIRERGNVIDYDVPITGNLKNPKFNLSDVFLDLFKNIFIKPPTTPYRTKIKNIETEIEKTLVLKWQMRDSLLERNQSKFLKKLAGFLEDNPKAQITVYPQVYETKEKEYILFFEAKKKYFLATNSKANALLSESDLRAIDRMSVKDSSFMHYLNKHNKDPMMFTIQEKCSGLISHSIVNSRYAQLNKNRMNTFMAYFIKKGVEKQIKILKAKSTVPYNGFSFYKMEYKGGVPEDFLEAYYQMNKLNNESPRKKFKKERNKTPNTP